MSDIFLSTYSPNFASKNQSGEYMAFFKENPLSKDYRFVINMPHAGFITSTTSYCTSGSATGTLKIDNTTLGILPLLPNSISSGKQIVAQSVLFGTGDDLILDLNVAPNCGDVTFTVNYIRGFT